MARQEGAASEFRKALRSTVVASVGPTCSAALRRYGLEVDLEPERPMMGALVAHAADLSGNLVKEKKNLSTDVTFPQRATSVRPIRSNKVCL